MKGFPGPCHATCTSCPKRAQTPSKTTPSNSRNPRRQVCTILRNHNAHGNLTKELLCEPVQTKPAGQSAYPTWTRPVLYSYRSRKNPLVWTHCLGGNNTVHTTPLSAFNTWSLPPQDAFFKQSIPRPTKRKTHIATCKTHPSNLPGRSVVRGAAASRSGSAEWAGVGWSSLASY